MLHTPQPGSPSCSPLWPFPCLLLDSVLGGGGGLCPSCLSVVGAGTCACRLHDVGLIDSPSPCPRSDHLYAGMLQARQLLLERGMDADTLQWVENLLLQVGCQLTVPCSQPPCHRKTTPNKGAPTACLRVRAPCLPAHPPATPLPACLPARPSPRPPLLPPPCRSTSGCTR